METSSDPSAKQQSGFGWGVLYGLTAPLLVVNIAQFLRGVPLHLLTRGGGTQLNLSLLGWMIVSILVGSFFGSLRRNVTPVRAADIVGIWVLSSMACYILLFQLVLWLGFIDILVIDALFIGGAFILVTRLNASGKT
ncbi:hypothetical protein EON80_06890 [bacterium]|nr:MAG: hypothetical protein EON80_06890 [bacterium]